MNIEEINAVVAQVQFGDLTFHVFGEDGGTIYLKGTFYEPDITSKVVELQHTRKWLLSKHMTKSEIVQTAFKCALTAMEHQVREAFTYRGRRIFGPHFDVDALVQICNDQRFDVRKQA